MRPAQRWTLHVAALAVGIPALTRSIVDTVNGKNPISAWLIALIVVLVLIVAIYLGIGLYVSAQTRAVRALRPRAQAFAFAGGGAAWDALSPRSPRAALQPTFGVLEVAKDELRIWRGTGYPQPIASIPYISLASIESQSIQDGIRKKRKLVLALKSTSHSAIAITIIRPHSLIGRAAPTPDIDDLASLLRTRAAHGTR